MGNLMADLQPDPASPNSDRRTFLKRAAAVGAVGAAGGGVWLGNHLRVSRSAGKKVIVIGIDGMDPRLTKSMMDEGLLPNLKKMSEAGGFSDLGTSIPPQSPVAWANFINGAGPGSHGIFDFIHRHPEDQCRPFSSISETIPSEDGWNTGEHRIPLDFWPFNHTPPKTVLRRQGVPFWDYLDAAGVPTTFYDLPSNYPPSPSKHGHHRCLCGMGTPDLLGDYPTYQLFLESGPEKPVPEQGGARSRLTFEAETTKAKLKGPPNSLLKVPEPIEVEFQIHRDRQANAAVIEIQGKKIVLKAGQWSRWTKIEFELSVPSFLPGKSVSGICRFYLQAVEPEFKLYVSPININPADPAVPISEPDSFVRGISKRLGSFPTTGFQEEYSARKNNVFNDDEFLKQATKVLEERLALFEYAVQNYDDGLLFFYFSSSDLQSHMFWWDSDAKHPTRTPPEAKKYFEHVKQLYRRLDAVIGDIYSRYGSVASIFVMSDHGFSNFGRQFNLNSWLYEHGYLQPPGCSSIMRDVDWSVTAAYGLGINGLYLNLKGRERDGIVEPGEAAEILLVELTELLEAEVDRDNGDAKVIRKVYRADEVYAGSATEFAPDLIVGYSRGYRASWETCLGDLTDQIFLDNESAWSADHCADAVEVPGLLVCNRPFRAKAPALIDLAPSILAEFKLPTPSSMNGKSIFS
jgi:predicted AlkP superfamily phosphohydrolase/phosphomutase